MTYVDFLARLAHEYPKTARDHDVRSLVIPSLIAPVAVEAPVQWWNEAERLVFLFHNRLRENDHAAFANPPRSHCEELRLQVPVIPKPSGASVLMSYDFHVDFSDDPVGRLRLIEVNTNASNSLITALVSAPLQASEKTTTTTLADQFAADFAEDLGRSLDGARIAIIDDEPLKQKMYIEFLLYKELLERQGASVVICDRRHLKMRDGKLWCGSDASGFGPIDLVYNRSTDFYFEEEASRPLHEAMMTKAAIITPHPYDYRMLADKNRLVEWSPDGALETLYGVPKDEADFIRRALLRTRQVTTENAEAFWKERKKLMFKPRTAYGGKGVYRGSSISRGAYEGAIASGSLAQDFVPAPTTKIGDAEFKYDLRFFAYRDRLHTACARIYQGQMTNATTPGGGTAALAVPGSFSSRL